MKQRLITLLLAAFLLFSAAFIPSCSQKGLYSEGSGELKIVASFFPAFDLDVFSAWNAFFLEFTFLGSSNIFSLVNLSLTFHEY